MPSSRKIADRSSTGHPSRMVWLCVAAALAVAAVPAGSATWVPPLPLPLGLTGTLGEYRTGHLHAGVDLSTGGVTGVPVRAVRSGSVVRIRASGGGYGRALHVRSAEGTEILYGHLERFAPALESYTRDAQRGAGEYEVDLAPDPGRFVVTAGDTIAWSGESGAGPPHLHLEVRENDFALNALTLGLSAPDLRPPELGPIGLRALGPEGFVGDSTLAIVGPHAVDPLCVWGRVGIECRVVDANGTTSARLAPLRIEVTLDGESIFVRRFDRMSIGAGPAVQRVYGTLFGAQGPWSYRLHHWPPGADPDPTEVAGETGIIDFAAIRPGEHRLCIEACDAAGGWSQLACRVEVRPPLRVARWRAAPDRSGGGWLFGLRLHEPVDSLRLPLRLQTADPRGDATGTVPAGAWRDAGEWLPLGEGWLCARAAGKGPVRVLDRTGRLLLPPIQPGAGDSGLEKWSASRVDPRIEEGMVLFELFPPVPFPGLPRASLILSSGVRVPLDLRGPSGDRGWMFACEGRGPAGEATGVGIEFDGESQSVEISLVGLRSFGPGEGVEPIRCLEGRLTLAPVADSFLDGATLAVGTASPEDSLGAWRAGHGDRPVGGLRAVSPVVILAPDWWPLSAPMRLRISLAALDPQFQETSPSWGLYRRDRQGGWRWLGRETDTDGVGATVTELGTFALLEDRVDPIITVADPEDGARLLTSPTALRVRVSDVGSGFDPREADIALDGSPLLTVWDVDEGTLSAPPERLTRGTHTWEVRVTDRAGNRTVACRRFQVTGP